MCKVWFNYPWSQCFCSSAAT